VPVNNINNQADFSISSLMKKGLKDRILMGAGSAFLFQVIGAGLGYVNQIVLARVLGVESYGVYTYVLSWALFLSILAQFGFPKSILRFVPEYQAKEKWDLLKGIIFRSWEVVFAAGIAVAGIMLIVMYALGGAIDSMYLEAFFIGVWLIPMDAMTNLQKCMGQALNNMSLAYLPNGVIRPLIIISSIFGLSAIYSVVTTEQALLITLAGFLVALAFQMVAIYRKVPAQSHEVKASYADKQWMSVSFSLLLTASFYVILDRTDVIMLGLMKHPTDVGFYNAASRTAFLVSFVLTSVNAVAAPTISQLYAQKKHEGLQRMAYKIVKMSFWPSLLISVGLYVLSGFILILFGHRFVSAGDILGILLIGQVFSAGTGSVGYFLNMTGYQKVTARVFAWSALINVVLNLAGISLLGAEGAAIATTVSMIIWNIWLHAHVKKEMNLRTAIIYTFRKSRE